LSTLTILMYLYLTDVISCHVSFFFFIHPPTTNISTFPYTTLFRSRRCLRDTRGQVFPRGKISLNVIHFVISPCFLKRPHRALRQRLGRAPLASDPTRYDARILVPRVIYGRQSPRGRLNFDLRLYFIFCTTTAT